MRDRNAELRGGQRGGERGVDIAGDNHGAGLKLGEYCLQALQRARGLHGVRAGTDAEQIVGLRQAELLEEDRRHLGVIMLTRVHQNVAQLRRASAHLADDRCHLDEVRPRADDVEHRLRGGLGYASRGDGIVTLSIHCRVETRSAGATSPRPFGQKFTHTGGPHLAVRRGEACARGAWLAKTQRCASSR